MNIGGDPRLNHQFEIVDGVRAEEAGALLSQFFAQRR
jgi:tRNA(Arg) A34 adenosine deaminase TadA